MKEIRKEDENAVSRKLRHIRNLLIFLVITVVFGGVVVGAVGLKMYQKVRYDEGLIQNLQMEISTVQTSQKAASFDNSIYKTDTFNYLAIGNSITSHGISSYWWNEGVGMAASKQDKDYEHVLGQMLGDDTIVASMNFYDWEAQAYDRAETLVTLDSYLSANLNLVTIQLGENVKDTSTLESDYEDLINYVKSKAPKAKVAVIGEFWKDEEKDSIKKQASEVTGAIFIDLSSMWDDESFEAGMGTTVYGSDGQAHTIDHDGVAKHPGDKGMQKIAELTYSAIKDK